jgi:hypothetical protein
MSGGRSSKRGTPQGGVVSPLLSVIYMNRSPDVRMSSLMPTISSSSGADTLAEDFHTVRWTVQSAP